MNQKGRPSKNGQVQIAREIRPYFEKCMTATFTANKTGHDIKTVCKYFNEWSKQVFETEDREFFQRQKESKELAILALDCSMYEQSELLKEVDEEMKKARKEGKPIPKYLITTKFMILRELSNMRQQKFATAMEGTPNFDIREYIESRVSMATTQ